MNKNKEEIEKINEEIQIFEKAISKWNDKKLDQEERDFNENIVHKMTDERKDSETNLMKFQERVKTSILWCEDEIEFLEKVIICKGYTEVLGAELKLKKVQLQTHLTWLKEQEKNNG